jgi:hypothetical protein
MKQIVKSALTRRDFVVAIRRMPGPRSARSDWAGWWLGIMSARPAASGYRMTSSGIVG